MNVVAVTKVFGSNEDNKVIALNGVSVKIEAGEFTALVGPSGSGKSTLLNVVSGLDHPTSGEVLLQNELISDKTGDEMSDFRRDNIGFIFQAYNLIPVLTVAENIEYVMLLQGKDRHHRRELVAQILKEVDLVGYEDRFPQQLSGGQQQRVAVARAIVSQPKIVLADEPTANLDSENGKSLVELMYRLNRNHNMTFLFSTHDSMIMEAANRIITMKDGVIIDDKIR
ncbi:MAG: ABC transporter ATP-binding protein [Bdellovibrionales bacterium]